MYPERIGQPRSGTINWEVAALDGLGVLLFFLPGAIAFMVDWYNGTLFLPPGNYGGRLGKTTEGTTISLRREQLNREGIEAAIFEQTGETISLEPGTYMTRQVQDSSEFETALATLIQELPLSEQGDQVLRCQSSPLRGE
ncbi:MAG: hypothetical protein R3C18_09895 [Planctomycetaceae bacterium]